MLRLDQSHVETVLPAVGKRVRIVNGAYRGCLAVLTALHTDRFVCSVRIDNGLYAGRQMDGVDYEDVCKVAE